MSACLMRWHKFIVVAFAALAAGMAGYGVYASTQAVVNWIESHVRTPGFQVHLIIPVRVSRWDGYVGYKDTWVTDSLPALGSLTYDEKYNSAEKLAARVGFEGLDTKDMTREEKKYMAEMVTDAHVAQVLPHVDDLFGFGRSLGEVQQFLCSGNESGNRSEREQRLWRSLTYSFGVDCKLITDHRSSALTYSVLLYLSVAFHFLTAIAAPACVFIRIFQKMSPAVVALQCIATTCAVCAGISFAATGGFRNIINIAWVDDFVERLIEDSKDPPYPSEVTTRSSFVPGFAAHTLAISLVALLLLVPTSFAVHHIAKRLRAAAEAEHQQDGLLLKKDDDEGGYVDTA
eukprot:GHVU01160943.1.p1 GENE.GHVU01160943.1~~GHVU01160943.1.p1  ORF type:complete len:345 (+),score=48.88 GHVU01160943.1:173-1207(+)